MIGAIASLAALVAGLVATGTFPHAGARRDGAPLAHPGAASAGTASGAMPGSASDLCAVCGVVEAVRPYETRTDGAARTAFRITVRMEDGSYRTLSQVSRPTVGSGDRVRIADGAVTPRSAP